MAATEQIFNRLLRQLCATDYGDDSSNGGGPGGFYHRSGLAELCFPNYELLEDSDDNDVTAWIPRVQIVDEPNIKNKPPAKFVLDAAQMHQIACYVLPREFAFRRWKRLFSLARDGVSFLGFMERIQKSPQTLFIVKTTKGDIFGGYSDTAWEFDNTNNNNDNGQKGGFHGGDQTKLFTFVHRDKRASSSRSITVDSTVANHHPRESRDDSEEKSEKKGSLKVYSWSGLNRDYQYCDPKRTLIGFGGGGGGGGGGPASFGLSIEKDFTRGTTAPCDTFSNDRLGSDDNFQIMDVEVWSFVALEDSCCASLLCFQTPKPEEDMNWIPSVRVIRDHPSSNVLENYILNQPQMNQIARFVLPQTIASCRWKRVYSLSRHGDSFETCLHLVRKEQRSLMVIKTEDNQVFGGYADSPWRTTNCNYYGSAQACLWTFVKDEDANATLDMSGSHSKIEPVDPYQVKVFKWTGINRYIQYCDMTHRILAFGGGGDGGNFGLCVEREFQTGTTGACATFGNTPLCNREQFNILDLEIWGFATGKF